MPTISTRDEAIAMDREDHLAHKRKAFELQEGTIYLDGNSLGPPPKAVFDMMDLTLRDHWAKGLITSHNAAGWFLLTDSLGDRIGALLGASAGEVVLCDSTGINVYKALHAAISMQPGRKVIVAEADSFPTDLYMIEGVTSLLTDMSVKLEGRDAESIEDLIDENTAVVLLNQVDYRSGVIRDVKTITERAHAVGALVVTDLSHAAGAIPVDLHDENVDFAVGCTYKYLNGGPGSTAYIYAASRHHGKFRQPLTGWFGHADPFKFESEYRQASGARAFLTGTQHVLSMIGVKAALDVFDDVDISALYKKGQALSTLFIDLVDAWCTPHGVGFYSPRDARLRNGQVSLTHKDGYAIVQALIARNVIGDFRQPNVMRFGFAPLYLRYVDIWDSADHLRQVLDSGQYKSPEFRVKNLVT